MSEPLSPSHWFTEVADEFGSAFSFKISERLHHEQSQYQTIDIYQTENFGKLMVIDGFVMLSSRDNFLYHEMMSHPALFTHPNPQRVVVIGGGDCGTLREVLKHSSVTEAIQVEIDLRVTELSQRYFPELCASNNDPRAQLLFTDGIKWMQDAADASVDVIIIDSTDPIGPAEGLFSAPFFTQCQRVLRQDGLLVQQSESPLYHLESIIKPLHHAMREGGFTQTKSLCFPQPVYPSGWWSATLASKQTDLTQFRRQDIDPTALQAHYYNADIHAGALATPNFMQGF